jgi:hypothetical protein
MESKKSPLWREQKEKMEDGSYKAGFTLENMAIVWAQEDYRAHYQPSHADPSQFC